MSVNSKMTAIADAIRLKTGGTAPLTLDGMATALNNIPTQPAITIMPSTSNQIAISRGTFATGNVLVQGDSNLLASNIASGVSIFGVSGTYVGSGGGDTSIEDGLIDGTITSYVNDRITTIRDYAFNRVTTLQTVSFAKCMTVGSSAFTACTSLVAAAFPCCTTVDTFAFAGCTKLSSVDLTSCLVMGQSAFRSCAALRSISLPVCTTIAVMAFMSCKTLSTITLPACTNISGQAFASCTALSSLYLPGSTICTLSNSNAFLRAGITSSTGAIYVPLSLGWSYKNATNWTYFSNRIFSIEGDEIVAPAPS